MALTAEALENVRDFVPVSVADDDTVAEQAENLGDDWRRVTLRLLRRWEAAVAAAPNSFTIPGEYGQTMGKAETLKMIAARISRVESTVDGESLVGFVRFVRPDRMRARGVTGPVPDWPPRTVV